MTTCLLHIDFRGTGNSDHYVRDGWSHPEATHRWTMGAESRLALPALPHGAVLVLCATPCLHPPALAAQTVMLALDGRLLTTVRFDGLHVTAWRLPAATGAVTLSLFHLHHAAPRGPGQMREGGALGLMVHSLRVFLPGAAPRPHRGLAGTPLAGHFESIGQGCHFGLVQRQCGVERTSLLRFVDTTTAMLYEALAAGLSGIAGANRLAWQAPDPHRPTWRWRQAEYGFCFNTLLPVTTVPPPTLERQAARLGLLRRKFLEDCALAERICVLTRSDCLTEAEALAIHCALTLHGPCTLLWTTYGDVMRTGLVERLAPGFLRGELGPVEDDTRYAPLPVWQTLMEQALKLS